MNTNTCAILPNLDFRVWIKPLQRYVYPEIYSNQSEEAHIMLFNKNKYRSEVDKYDFDISDPTNYEAEHYVGLKDHKNKKLYEGDIVEIPYSSFGHLAQSPYNPLGYMVNMGKTNCIINDYTRDNIIKYLNKKDIILIGNIRETPNLITSGFHN